MTPKKYAVINSRKRMEGILSGHDEMHECTLEPLLRFAKSKWVIIYKVAIYIVGFEVFTAVVMKSIIFWDVTPCSLLSCN
jgi:hypothetical protein